MDPRISWCTPEQIGPALEHWLRLWEESSNLSDTDSGASSGDMTSETNSAKANSSEKLPEFISLTEDSKEKQTDRQKGTYRNGDVVNKASTYGLNSLGNLHLLKSNKLTPWMKPESHYDHLPNNIIRYV